MNFKQESDLIYLGRRLDKALSYIQSNEPDLAQEFISSVGDSFEYLLSQDLSLEEEDYIFDQIDQALDYLEQSYGTMFEQD